MKKILVVLFVSCFLLSGCSSFKKWFGLNKSSPDETKIETRAPLVLPPDFDELPSTETNAEDE